MGAVLYKVHESIIWHLALHPIVFLVYILLKEPTVLWIKWQLRLLALSLNPIHDMPAEEGGG